jgi:hypothetical protein
MKKLIVIAVVLAVVVAVYFLFVKSSSDEVVSQEEQTFSDAELGFSFKYLAEMIFVRENANTARVYMAGPTQTDGTELFDGFSMAFTKSALVADTLKESIEEEISQVEQMNGEITVPLETFVLNGIDGYTFTFVGLGEFISIYVPFDEENYIGIFYLVEDPGDMGYQDKIDDILASFELLK